MTDYRELTRPERRALDRYARSHNLKDPLSYWPDINSAAFDQLLQRGLVETAGTAEDGERLYRISDAGARVHDEMWKDGKVPHHPVSTGGSDEETI
jgi:hypothetical protein